MFPSVRCCPQRKSLTVLSRGSDQPESIFADLRIMKMQESGHNLPLILRGGKNVVVGWS